MGLRRSVYKHIGLLPRPWKRMAMVGMDLVVLPACVYLAYALRFGDVTPGLRDIWWLFIFTPLLTVPIFWALGLYRAIVRYMGSAPDECDGRHQGARERAANDAFHHGALR